MVLCNMRIPTLALFISLGYLIASINIVLAAPVDEGTLQSIYARLQDPRRGVQPQQPQISPPNHQEAASVYWIRLFAVLHGILEQKVASYMFQMRQRDENQAPPQRFSEPTPNRFWAFIASEREGFRPGRRIRVGLDTVSDMQHMFDSRSAERMMGDRTEPPRAFRLTLTNHFLPGNTPAFLSRRWEVNKAHPDVIWNRELNALFAEILKSVLEYRHWEDQMNSHVQPPSRTLAECWEEIMVDISRFIAENNQAGRRELADEWGVKLTAARHASQSNTEPPNPVPSYPTITWRSPGARGSPGGLLFDPFHIV